MVSKAAFQAIPFKGKFGQTINPGDKVIFITMCTKTMGVGEGTYQGMINGRARIAEDHIVTTYHHPVTGADITDWSTSRAFAAEVLGPEPNHAGYMSPFRSRPDEIAEHEAKRKAYNEWSERYREVMKTRIKRDTPAVRTRILRNNVMFLKA